jgi:hypothetical protein
MRQSVNIYSQYNVLVILAKTAYSSPRHLKVFLQQLLSQMTVLVSVNFDPPCIPNAWKGEIITANGSKCALHILFKPKEQFHQKIQFLGRFEVFEKIFFCTPFEKNPG